MDIHVSLCAHSNYSALTQALCRRYLCMFNRATAIVVGNNATNTRVYIYELFRALKTIFII